MSDIGPLWSSCIIVAIVDISGVLKVTKAVEFYGKDFRLPRNDDNAPGRQMIKIIDAQHLRF